MHPDLIKIAIYYNKLLHTDLVPYKPTTNIDEVLKKAYPIFLNTLPSNSSSYSITDVGSGAGKWTAILSMQFSNVISIEPKAKLEKLQHEFLFTLKVKNVEIKQQYMPKCVDEIKTDGIFFSESLYLADNWADVISRVVSNNYIRFIGILDGIDGNPFNGLFHSPLINNNNRLPLLANDEFKIKQVLENNGFKCKLFDVLNQKETIESSKRWYLTGEKE